MKPCTTGSMAAVGASAGKEFSLKQCTTKSTEEDITGKQECSLMLFPAESMEAEEYSLKLCSTKRKAPAAGHLHSLEGGATKRKGEDCSVGDIAASDVDFPEELDKSADAGVLADVTMDEIAEQAISDTRVAVGAEKGSPGTDFSELGKSDDAKLEADKTMGEQEEKPFRAIEVTAPHAKVDAGETKSLKLSSYSLYNGEEEAEEEEEDDATIPDEEFDLFLAQLGEDFEKFTREMFKGKQWMTKVYTMEDFVEKDEEVSEHHVKVEAAL